MPSSWSGLHEVSKHRIAAVAPEAQVKTEGTLWLFLLPAFMPSGDAEREPKGVRSSRRVLRGGPDGFHLVCQEF